MTSNMMDVYVGANVWARVEAHSLIGAVRKIAEATQVPFDSVYTEQASWGWNVCGPDGPFGTVVIESRLRQDLGLENVEVPGSGNPPD